MSSVEAIPDILRRHGFRRWLRTGLAQYWPILIVLTLFFGTALVVPTLTPVATTDDWGYSRSVEILLDEGRLTVFPVVAATAVFQIGWGATFGLIFGMSLGLMRLSTVVMVALGAIALYGLLRELGVGRSRSALGTAAYLFNPLMFVLSYTFMTDPFLTSLVIGSAYFYVRGLRRDSVALRYVLAGSLIAGCAFLTRQQGILVPVAVGMALLFSRRLRFDRATVKLVLAVAASPAIMLVGYYLWLYLANDVPSVQQSFSREIRGAGIEGSWRLGHNLSFIILMYFGFFALPLAVAVLIGMLPRLWQGSRKGLAVVIPWLAIPWLAGLILGLVSYAAQGKRWPYIPQFVNAAGLGPTDVLGSRTRLLNGEVFTWLTLICAVFAMVVAVVISRGIGFPPSQDRTAAGIVLAITIWQVIGVLPPSFHYIRRGYSLDRYLLPLLPLIICLLLWSLRDLRVFQPVGWAIIAGLIAYNVAATRDYLTFLDTVWSTADEVVATGIPETSIDAGASWDGYHLYTYGLDNDITRARTRNGPWWMTFYGLASDSTYVVSSTPRDGYQIMWTRTYDQWLVGGDPTLYVLRRIGAPELPDPAATFSANPESLPENEMPTQDPDRILLIAARNPIAGETKTRLGATIGMPCAAKLYEAFLHDLAGRFMVDDLPYDLGWAYTPESHPFRETIGSIRPDLNPDLAHYVMQHGADWAIRQAQLLRWGAEQGYATTVLMASDSPQITRAMVDQAFDALENADVVVGRVHDGGYYLVGVRGYHDVVTGVPMSTVSAAERLILQAKGNGLSVATVEPTFDVDVESDLSLLAELCETNPAAAPATCKALRELGLLAWRNEPHCP